MEITDKLYFLLSDAIVASLKQIIWLFGPLFLIGFALYWVSKLRNQALNQSIGGKACLFLTSLAGTPVHVAGQALFCLIFGHKITEIKFFPSRKDGTTGYIKHEYNSKSIYQRIGNFFIGIAPMFFGALVIYILLWIFLPWCLPQGLDEGIRITGWKIFKNIIFNSDNFGSWRFWVFFYLSLSVASHTALNTNDLKGTVPSFFILLGLIFIVNLIASAFLKYGLDSLSFTHLFTRNIDVMLSLFYSIMLYALAISVLYLIFSYLLFWISKPFRRKS
ncbi:MAG: hypothetical protein FWF67_03745 [Fibromonadales bacterium]|nr:hypothetical protein [Fibromonadales bacterium]